VVKHSKLIAIGTVVLVALVLLVAYVSAPRQTEGTSPLTPQQQERVDDRLNQCFATGDC
jgi:hypothetical protein